jgi:Flp pilus assembly protein TadG
MKRIRNEKGAALVEAAIVMPMILLISVGIFEFGRAYQTSQVLTNAAREGARLAILDGPTDGDVRARVNKYLTDGGLTSLADGNILVNRKATLTGSASASTVQVNYPFQFMMLNPIVRLVVPGDSQTGAPITLTAATLMRNE